MVFQPFPHPISIVEFDRVYLVLFMLNSINIKEKTNNTPNSLTRHGLKPLMLVV